MSQIRFVDSCGESFIIPKNTVINWYNCGPTIYNRSHLGHARTFCLIDNIRRYLILHGYNINFGFNITDIDDKIANKVKELIKEKNIIDNKIDVYMRYINEMEKYFWLDYGLLNMIKPDKILKVSDVINEIEEYIDTLINNEYAYKSISSNSIYFDIDKYEEFYTHTKMYRGNEKDINNKKNFLSEKKSNRDFALWKEKIDNDETIGFITKFGFGTPGWHIECSVMQKIMFGDDVFLHSGGIDLAYPHHSNEIIQCTAYHEKLETIKHFIHVGHLHIDGKKMSQSLGNFTTINEILKKTTANTLRLLFMTTLWSNQMDLNDGMIENAQIMNKKIDSLRYDIIKLLNKFGIDHTNLKKEKIDSKYLNDCFDNVKFIIEYNDFIINVNKYIKNDDIDSEIIKNYYQKMLGYEFIIGLEYNDDVDIQILEIVKFRSEMRNVCNQMDKINDLFDRYSFDNNIYGELNKKLELLKIKFNKNQLTKKDIYIMTDWIRDIFLLDLGYNLDDNNGDDKIYKI